MRATNPIGVHALVWAGDTSDASIDRAVRMTAESGFTLLELSLHDLGDLDLERTRCRLEEAGLELACSRGLAPGADVSSDDPSVVARGAALLQESLRATIDLGGHTFTGALYSSLGKYPGPPTERGRANAIAVIRDLAGPARAAGVGLGIEVVSRYLTNVVNTAEQAVRFVDDIGEDNVFVHLDTLHMNIEEDDFVRPVHLVGDRLGSGHVDFTSFFHALGDIGYTGPITFESFSSAVVAPGLSNDLAIWRELWSDGADLGSHARRFIADHLDVSHVAG